jgi:hypothetical protein
MPDYNQMKDYLPDYLYNTDAEGDILDLHDQGKGFCMIELKKG